MSENIKLKKENFTLLDGYFYMFDDDTDVLYQRTADSSTSFSFPLDSLLSNEIKSLEHDGANFWTLEESGTDSLSIKRWKITNYICVQQQQINLNAGAGHSYDADAFTVEHYHTTLSGTVLNGEDRLPVMDYWEKVSSGMTVTVGPNHDGVIETINVQDWEDGNIVLADPVTVDYAQNVEVCFYTNIWLFNNFSGEDATTAALYKINAYTGSYITRYEAAEYKDVTACTFFKITALDAFPNTDMLCYVKATNMIFVNVFGSGLNLTNYGSMLLDNVQDDDVNIIDVVDLAIEDDNIYKLQYKANYFGGTESWNLANYHVATQTKIVTSISLLTSKSIIPADNNSTTLITARVRDQFWQPVAGRGVTFDHDEVTTGAILPDTPVNTGPDGEATATYKSGTKATEVRISALVSQV